MSSYQFSPASRFAAVFPFPKASPLVASSRPSQPLAAAAAAAVAVAAVAAAAAVASPLPPDDAAADAASRRRAGPVNTGDFQFKFFQNFGKLQSFLLKVWIIVNWQYLHTMRGLATRPCEESAPNGRSVN